MEIEDVKFASVDSMMNILRALPRSRLMLTFRQPQRIILPQNTDESRYRIRTKRRIFETYLCRGVNGVILLRRPRPETLGRCDRDEEQIMEMFRLSFVLALVQRF